MYKRQGLRDETLPSQRFLLAELALCQLQGGVGGANLGLEGSDLGQSARLAEVLQLLAGRPRASFGFGQGLRIGVSGNGENRLTFGDATATRAVERLEVTCLRCSQVEVLALDVALEKRGLIVTTGGEQRGKGCRQ